jgi:transcriptional regulator with XRE-family HTH domain
MKTLAERINERLLATGIRPSELAAQLKISRPSVTNWRNGKTKIIRGDLIHKVAKILQCDAIWLQTGSGYMPVVTEDQTAYPVHSAALQTLNTWPFKRITPAQYQKLHPEQKKAIEQMILGFSVQQTEEKQLDPAKVAGL